MKIVIFETKSDVTLSLTSDDLESHIVVNVSSTLTNTTIWFVAALSLIVDLWTDVLTDGRTFLPGLLGHLSRDNLKRLNEWKDNVENGGMNPVTGTGCTSVDIGVNANLQLVDKFCYLGDMLSVDGDADADVETRI